MYSVIKVHSPEKKSSNKLRQRKVVCKLLSFVDKSRILKNSHCLKGTSYYVNEDFSKETLGYRKELWEKVKAFRKKGEVAYINYKSIVVRERKLRVRPNITDLINMITKSSNASKR